jgi:hypothetical protein
MVEFSFSVTGKPGKGGNGFVFWYTKDYGNRYSKEFYGRSAKFEGAAIVFDSADVSFNRHLPFIYLISNNGTKEFADFVDYTKSTVHLGSCFREYRNSPAPVFAKVMYSKEKLFVDIDIRQKGKGYTRCMEVPIKLPSGYHFGLSGSTGHEGSMDDHDFFSFETYELNPPPKAASPKRPHEEEDIKAGKEFHMDEEMWAKIEEIEKDVRENTSDDQDEKQSLGGFETIIENQFQVLEALAGIQDKLDIKPGEFILTTDHQEALEIRLKHQIDSLK